MGLAMSREAASAEGELRSSSMDTAHRRMLQKSSRTSEAMRAARAARHRGVAKQVGQLLFNTGFSVRPRNGHDRTSVGRPMGRGKAKQRLPDVVHHQHVHPLDRILR